MPDRLSAMIKQGATGAKSNAATYAVHGVVTRVYADNHLLALAVQDFLRSFRVQPDVKPDIEFFLLTEGSGRSAVDSDSLAAGELLYNWQILRYGGEKQLRFQQVPGAGVVAADLEAGTAVALIEESMAFRAWSVAHVFFFPMWAQLLKTRGIFPIHAAGLERHGRGLLFPGRSGCGKSTLSLSLLRHGYKLLGDDTVFVRRAGTGTQMLFFPEEADVSAATLDLRSQLALARNLKVDGWQPRNRVNLRGTAPGATVEASSADLLVFPVIAENGRTRYERVKPTDALAELILYAFLFMDPQTSKENFGLLANLVQSASCYRLHMGSDGVELAGAVEEMVAAA